MKLALVFPFLTLAAPAAAENEACAVMVPYFEAVFSAVEETNTQLDKLHDGNGLSEEQSMVLDIVYGPHLESVLSVYPSSNNPEAAALGKWLDDNCDLNGG